MKNEKRLPSGMKPRPFALIAEQLVESDYYDPTSGLRLRNNDLVIIRDPKGKQSKMKVYKITGKVILLAPVGFLGSNSLLEIVKKFFVGRK